MRIDCQEPSERWQGEGAGRRLPGRKRPVGRRGAVLMVTLVCIGVASLMFLVLLRLSVLQRRGTEADAWQSQAAWLVESGLERAAARLADDSDYQGETWNLPPDALGGGEGAEVQIEVERIPEQSKRRLVRVRADYPNDPLHRARQSKRLVIEVRPSS